MLSDIYNVLHGAKKPYENSDPNNGRRREHTLQRSDEYLFGQRRSMVRMTHNIRYDGVSRLGTCFQLQNASLSGLKKLSIHHIISLPHFRRVQDQQR